MCTSDFAVMSYKINIIIGLLIVVISAFSCRCSRVTYHNYRLYKVHLATDEDVTELVMLRDNFDSLIFIDDDLFAGNDVHIVVAPHMVPEFEYDLDNQKISYTLVSSNLLSLLQNSDPQDEMTSLIGYSFDGKSYVTLYTTYQWLNSLQSRDPDTITLFEVGDSTENRPIVGVEISRKLTPKLERNAGFADKETGTKLVYTSLLTLTTNILQYLTQTKKETIRPGIFIEAGIHGNDWISSATASYIVQQLLKNPTYQRLTMMFDWFIVPHANPDGYEYSGTTDRLWRKSRSGKGPCNGVDLSRNFGLLSGRRDNVCLNNYPGTAPFSEKESNALKETIKLLKSRVRLYISLHGGYEFAVKPAASTHTIDQGENFNNTLSRESWSSAKWVYDSLGISSSFDMQLGLRNKSSKAKNPKIARPASEIKPIGEEAMKAIVELIAGLNIPGFFM